MTKLNEVFLIKETSGKSVSLTPEEIDAILYCMDYADEKDDEGIRTSEPEAVARQKAMDSVYRKLGRGGP